MIKITRNNPFVLLRVNNYKDNSFINVHREYIEEYGSVWMLKVGRRIPEERLLGILNSDGVVVLKGPKAVDDQFYAAHIVDGYYGLPKDEMTFPDYYYDMIDDENLVNMENGLEGTWFCVDKIVPIPHDIVNSFSLLRTGEKVEVVLNKTRTSMLYVLSDIDCTLV